MEPYIALIKAIIISGISANCVSTVTITDQYIVSVVKCEESPSGNEDMHFDVYDLKNERIYRKHATSSDWDTVNIASFSPVDMKSGIRSNKFISTKTRTESLEGYKCKVVENEMERYSVTEGSINYKEVSYYAKIPLLDSALNTAIKKKVAGFPESPDERFPFLISQYTQYKSGMTKNDVLKIIEESGIDPALLEDLIKGKIEK